MVLFAPKTAVVGLRHLTQGVNTSTCQQVKFESYYNEGNILIHILVTSHPTSGLLTMLHSDWLSYY